MFVELIEHLRCPREHEESPLIVAADRTEGRSIMVGTLGCPVCRSEFPIRAGEALFADAATAGRACDADMAIRLAAALGLTDASGYVLLCGGWGACAGELATLVETPILLVNPPRPAASGVSGIIRTDGVLPLAASSARAAALDDDAHAGVRAGATRAVRRGGRLVGPAALPLPDGASQLARDARMWVAEKTAAPDEPAPLVTLRRA